MLRWLVWPILECIFGTLIQLLVACHFRFPFEISISKFHLKFKFWTSQSKLMTQKCRAPFGGDCLNLRHSRQSCAFWLQPIIISGSLSGGSENSAFLLNSLNRSLSIQDDQQRRFIWPHRVWFLGEWFTARLGIIRLVTFRFRTKPLDDYRSIELDYNETESWKKSRALLEFAEKQWVIGWRTRLISGRLPVGQESFEIGTTSNVAYRASQLCNSARATVGCRWCWPLIWS